MLFSTVSAASRSHRGCYTTTINPLLFSLLLFFTISSTRYHQVHAAASRLLNEGGCLAQDNECGPNRPCPSGECCSQFGWCGADGPSFCGECCQSNCYAAMSGGGGEIATTSYSQQQQQQQQQSQEAAALNDPEGTSAFLPTVITTPSRPSSTTTSTTTSYNDKVKEALLTIYSTCNGRNWERKSNWASDTLSPCTWEGITCSSSSSSSSSSTSNYEVIEISLRSNNMVGTFPTAQVFNNIPTLTALSLEGNTDLLFSFTGGVTQPTKLQSLDISKTKFNSFTGVNVHFTQLKEVYAGRAVGLIGTFPSELLDISQLQVLDLSFNHMTGELPRDIGVFWGNMQNLVLQNNQFMGLIPDSIEYCTTRQST